MSLTEDVPFDINTLIEETLLDIEAEDAGQEDGPESQDEGELSDDDADASVEDEDAVDEEEGAEDESEEETEEAQEEADPVPTTELDERDQIIERLNRQVREANELQTKLLDLMEQQRTAKEAVPTTQALPTEDLDAVRVALWGATEKDQAVWDGLSPTAKRNAEQFRNDHAERETRYALSPESRYQEQIRDLVMRDVQQVVGPLLAERDALKAKAIYQQEVGDLPPEDNDRLRALYNDLPGSEARAGFEANQKAFKAAVKLFKAEKAAAGLHKEQAKVRSKTKQLRANKKAARRSAPRTSSASGTQGIPALKPGQDLAQYFETLRDLEP
jgi:hypothetical protein